jgi:hypothetical protein
MRDLRARTHAQRHIAILSRREADSTTKLKCGRKHNNKIGSAAQPTHSAPGVRGSSPAASESIATVQRYSSVASGRCACSGTNNNAPMQSVNHVPVRSPYSNAADASTSVAVSV